MHEVCFCTQFLFFNWSYGAVIPIFDNWTKQFSKQFPLVRVIEFSSIKSCSLDLIIEHKEQNMDTNTVDFYILYVVYTAEFS